LRWALPFRGTLELLSHILDFVPNVLDQLAPSSDLIDINAIPKRVPFDGTNAIDEVLKV